MERSSAQTRKWPPWEDGLKVAGTVIFIGGLLVVSILFHLGPEPGETSQTEYVWTFVMIPFTLGAHALIEFATMRRLGTRPSFKFWVRGKPLRGSGWMAEGYKLTREQYAAIYLVPYLCTIALGVLYLLLAPEGNTGILYMVAYLLGFLWAPCVAALALFQPRGTLFEERAEGSRLHLPT